jgi:hypothetical protein
MPSAMVNIVIGLVTSLLSGASVWLWQHARSARVLRRKAAFFGIGPGERCLLILSRHHRTSRAMAHRDIRALLDVVGLVEELGGEVAVEVADEFAGTNGDRTEFCIGGPAGDVNRRSAAYLARHLPGVARAASSGPTKANRHNGTK